MPNRLSFEKILLNPGASLLVRTEFKRVMLTGYLATLCFIVSIIYSVVDISNGVYYSMPSYVLLFFTSLLVFILIKHEKYSFAKVLLMVNANLVVFYAAINDPPGTGANMLFIPAGTSSFAILGFNERFKAILIAVLSTILFLMAFFGGFHIQNPVPSETYVTTSFMINFIISLSIVVSIFYLLGNLNDISERELIRKQKAELEKNDQLVKINTELDQFIYSLSHDLRSPLSSIRGLVNIGIISKDPDEMQKCFSLIEDRAKAQEFFINEIIEIYRNNRLEIKPERISLNKLVVDIVQETSFEPGAAAIKFKIEIDETLEIVTDRLRLKSILFNLIGNAIKYHDPSKSDKFVLIGSEASGSTLKIFVEDNGKGIAAEHLPKIFDMFYRASEDAKGSGLGLYIVKEMATKLNGSVMAESEHNKGTKFTLQLQ